jgi:hypothetical protein
MTVQSIITTINTIHASTGTNSIGMDNKSLKIKPKSRSQKPDNPDKILNNYPTRRNYNEVLLSSYRIVPSTLSKKNPEPINLDLTTS